MAMRVIAIANRYLIDDLKKLKHAHESCIHSVQSGNKNGQTPTPQSVGAELVSIAIVRMRSTAYFHNAHVGG